MRSKLLLLLIPVLLFLSGCSIQEVFGARTSDFWKSVGTYITTNAPAGFNILINGTSKYLNFNTTVGTGGYGFRDSSGLIQVKHSGGAWTTIATSTPAGNGIVTLNGLTADSQIFATSSDTNIGLTIVSASSTHTFTPTWIGTLANSRIASSTEYLGALSDSTWTLHNSYPAACAAGEYVTAIGDTLTCGALTTMTYPGAGIALSTGSAWGASITDNSANWNTAYTDRLKWDGGATGLVAATGRTSLGLGTMALEPNTGSTTITTLGTITTGVWGGNAIPANKGGTALTTFTSGSLLYASAANTWSALASSTYGKVLWVGSAGFPEWTATSTLGISGGGSSLTSGDISDFASTTGETFNIGAPTGSYSDGTELTIRLKATSSQSIAWNSAYRGSSDLALPSTHSGNNKTNYYKFIYNSTDTKWDYFKNTNGF